MKKLSIVLVVLLMMAGGFWSCGGSSGGGANPAFTGDCAPLGTPNTTAAFKERLNKFAEKRCYAKQGWEHDAEPRTSQNVHDTFIQIYYSPTLFKWMDKNGRKGPVPDGSIAIKEEYANQTDPPSKIQFWSVMIHDSKLWWDGWYWAVVGMEVGAVAKPAAASDASACPDPDTFNLLSPVANPGGVYPTSLNCAGCHASAQTDGTGMGTYSSPDFIKTKAAAAAGKGSSAEAESQSGSAGGALSAHAGWVGAVLRARTQVTPNPPSGFTGRLPSSIFANVKMLPADVTIPCMVPESADFVFSKPAASGGPSLFVTSNQCFSCHDATNNFPMPTNMLYPVPGTTTALNLSPDGEWRYSMMGLAGRDPVFFSQLNSEGTLHDNIKGKPNPTGFVQDTCLSCHGVMGQRQFHIDKGNDPNTLFTRDILQDSTSPYGALARDGISCAVCHHVADEDPEDPAFFTGKFQVGPANELYGPYPSGEGFAKVGDNVIPRPMSASVGIIPIFGSQIQQSKVCASCHTIVLPVYDSQGNQVMEGGVPKTDFEQTTYFEWLNSSFAPTGSSPKACQGCHMPDNFDAVKLSFAIANIEDSTFPRIPIEGPITTWPTDELILETRTAYNRHQLLGANPFVMEMFDQFRTDLGLYSQDLLLPPPTPPVTSITDGHTNAINGVVTQAQTATATVVVGSATRTGGNLQADVTVTNLAGHNLPSGVSFRRAFLDFQVLDANGVVLWESGGTDANGVIVDTSGTQLPTEFFSPTQQNIQPHFWTGNPITSDQQVQIYEEIILDPQGLITTSFLALNDKIKENRIQPNGRSSSGPHGDLLAPVGTGADPSYTNGCGCSVVRYQIPLTTPGLSNAAKVQATLYYQSIPPYYLRQRAEDATGPDTQRLINFASQLDTTKYTEISNWKLLINSSGPTNIQ